MEDDVWVGGLLDGERRRPRGLAALGAGRARVEGRVLLAQV